MEAVVNQHDLGWDNMMKGCVSTNWGWAQQKHFEIFSAQSPTTAREHWEKDLINLLWNCFYHIWAARDDILHNSAHDPDSTSALNKQIRSTYSALQHRMEKHDQQLFCKSLEERLLLASVQLA
eukprot:12242309-Ditylum_brightwellii.AAC.1